MSESSDVGKSGYSWPPFEPGNEVGMVHGARGRRVGPLALHYAEQLLESESTPALLLPENHPCWWEPMHGRGRCCARWRLVRQPYFVT